MSLPKRRVDVDPDISVRDLLRLLDTTGDPLTMVIMGRTVEVHEGPGDETQMTDEEKRAIGRSAIGGWHDLIDLDELERSIYEGRDQDPIKPPVVLD
jgi:hypothetical protein